MHLKKIKENGKFHKALIKNNIHTDSDLKQMYKKDRDKLKDEVMTTVMMFIITYILCLMSINYICMWMNNPS